MAASAAVDEPCQPDTMSAAPPRPALNMRHTQAVPRTITPDHLAPYSSTSPLKRRLALPESSRVDPAMIQREAPTGGMLSILGKNWSSFLWFLGTKGFDIAGAMLRYGLFGPLRPSWGIEMTLVCAFMRNLAAHSALTDITLMRQLISVHYLLPLPPDAMVTPITFTIKKRSEPLRGFFTELDTVETGDRELSGEWVVGRNVWRRLKAERARAATADRKSRRGPTGLGMGVASDVRSSSASQPRSADRLRGSEREDAQRLQAGDAEESQRKRKRSEKVIYYIHGGAYYVGSAATHRLITIALSKVCDARVFAINYRLSPEVRFPCALHDVIRGYLRLTESLHISPSNIIIMGDSAGGSLALALSMYLRDEGYRLPRALVLMSPWVDMTMSCGSWDENAKYDVIPMPVGDDHLNPIQCFLGPLGMKQYLTHPYASPLFGDFTGLPPMLIQAGDAEVLRDEVTLLAHKAALAGVEVKSELFVDAVHVFQAFPFLESAATAFQSIGNFVHDIRDRPIDSGREEMLSRSAAAADIERPSSRASSVDAARSDTSPRGSLDSAVGVDTIGNEIAAGDLTIVRSDGTEVKRAGKERAELADDLFAPQGANVSDADTPASPPYRLPNTRARAPSAAAASVAPSPSKGTVPKPLLRRAISSFTRSGMDIRRRAPSVSFFGGGSAEDDADDSDAPRPTTAQTERGGRHSRRPSIFGQLMLSPAKPTTRLRSKSNVDLVQMMEGYSRDGPANETMVYTPHKGDAELPSDGEASGEDESGSAGALGLAGVSETKPDEV